MTKIKKTLAAIIAATTLIAGTSFNVSATNSVFVQDPVKSGSNVYFKALARNTTNSDTDFVYSGMLYDITTPESPVYTAYLSDVEYDTTYNESVTLSTYKTYSSLTNSTMCKSRVSSYVVYSANSQPYESSEYVYTYYYK